MATAGDVNGDGYADILIGAPQVGNSQTDEGRVLIYYARPSAPATQSFYTRNGEAARGPDALSGNNPRRNLTVTRIPVDRLLLAASIDQLDRVLIPAAARAVEDLIPQAASFRSSSSAGCDAAPR